MMSPTARCFLLLPVVVAVPGRLAPARTAVVTSARRGGARRDRSWDYGGGSGDEDAIDESFFGEPRDDDEEPEEEEERRRGRRPASPGETQLRGSDVLRALQRASAAKEASKKKKKQQESKGGARPAARRQGKQGDGGVTAVQAVGEVTPIEIRREWAPTIRQLELRVQRLVDNHHHHQN